MSSAPDISVVMAVWNGLPYLDEAVRSVLNQTHRDFEFVIVDDGSTDGSTDVLRRFAGEDSRIRLVEQENRGLTPSLNSGLTLSTGRYVARMDADDVCEPRRFEIQAAFLDEHDECVVVGSEVTPIDAEGRVLSGADSKRTRGNAAFMAVAHDHEDIDVALLTGKWSIVHPSVMIRRSALDSIGGYRHKYVNAEDRDLFLRLAEIGRIVNLEQKLLRYRCHPDQISGRSAVQRYWSDRARRAAFIRRGIDVPDELGVWPMIRASMGKEIRKTPLWPYVLRAFNSLR